MDDRFNSSSSSVSPLSNFQDFSSSNASSPEQIQRGRPLTGRHHFIPEDGYGNNVRRHLFHQESPYLSHGQVMGQFQSSQWQPMPSQQPIQVPQVRQSVQYLFYYPNIC